MFTPADAGVYRWKVSYSGDDHNHGAGPTPCGDPSEAGYVRPPDLPPAVTSLASSASAPAGVGAPISDVAHLTSGVDPSGAITFELFGPDDSACAGPLAFTSTVAVAGNGDYVSDAFVPSRPGAYRWVVSYSGDAKNTAAGPTACGDPAETVSVAATPGATPSPGPNARPASRTKPRRNGRQRHRAPRFTG